MATDRELELELEVIQLKAEVKNLREQVHRERNEAAVQYGNYERRIRDLKTTSP